jgi:hypothetical protein
MLSDLSKIDEVDIIDPLIIEFYASTTSEGEALYCSQNMILIDSKLGISKDVVPSLFKQCKPLMK